MKQDPVLELVASKAVAVSRNKWLQLDLSQVAFDKTLVEASVVQSLLNSPFGFSQGLGGAILLFAVKGAKYRALVKKLLQTHLQAISGARTAPSGLMVGAAGIFMLGVALEKLGLLSPEHRDVLRTKVDLLRPAPGRLASMDLGKVCDLATGSAGNLIGLARARDLFGRQNKTIEDIGREIRTALIENVASISPSTEVLHPSFNRTSLMHGLPGTLLALLQDQPDNRGREFARLSEIISASIKRGHGEEKLNFCWSHDAALAVLRFYHQEDADWPSPPHLPGVSHASVCCGLGGNHLARLASLRLTIPFIDKVEEESTSLGYFGHCGLLYVLHGINKQIPLYDPFWGREILVS